MRILVMVAWHSVDGCEAAGPDAAPRTQGPAHGVVCAMLTIAAPLLVVLRSSSGTHNTLSLATTKRCLACAQSKSPSGPKSGATGNTRSPSVLSLPFTSTSRRSVSRAMADGPRGTHALSPGRRSRRGSRLHLRALQAHCNAQTPPHHLCQPQRNPCPTGHQHITPLLSSQSSCRKRGCLCLPSLTQRRTRTACPVAVWQRKCHGRN